jgi:hypothetical protein
MTLSLLTKVTANLPLVTSPWGHVAGCINAQGSKPFPRKKSQPCCSIDAVQRMASMATWLKTHEINALKTH